VQQNATQISEELRLEQATTRRTTMTIMNLIRNEEGATALEYGLLAALIAGVIAAGVTSLGTTVQATFSGLADKMTAATATGS